jgi:hypothetical protein
VPAAMSHAAREEASGRRPVSGEPRVIVMVEPSSRDLR